MMGAFPCNVSGTINGIILCAFRWRVLECDTDEHQPYKNRKLLKLVFCLCRRTAGLLSWNEAMEHTPTRSPAFQRVNGI